MPIDFSKFQKKAPDIQDEKITLGEKAQKRAHAHPEKKSIQDINVQKSNLTVEKLPGEKITPGDQKKSTLIKTKIIQDKKSPKNKMHINTQFDAQLIDQKINERINERLLKLVKIALNHELTIDNMVLYFKQVNKTKLYELRRYFSDSSSYEIERMQKFLHSTGVIKKDKNNWYSLK